MVSLARLVLVVVVSLVPAMARADDTEDAIATATQAWARMEATGLDGDIVGVTGFVQAWADWLVRQDAGDAGEVRLPVLTEAMVQLAALTVGDDGPLDRGIAVLPAGGSAEWDAAVRQLLIARHDADGSRALDRRDEIDAVACPTWGAVDRGVRRRWAAGFWTTYGVGGGMWLGPLLGLEGDVRLDVGRALARCGLAITGTALPAEGLAGELLVVPEPASDAWDEVVAARLVAAFDTDADGRVAGAELEGVPCDVLRVVDAAARVTWGSGFLEVYGVLEATWVADRLGFAAQRDDALGTRATTCDVEPEPFARGVVRGSDRAARVHAVPGGGGETWDRAVRSLLVDWYDADRTGAVDTDAEVASVACDVWWALDEAVRRRYPSGLYLTYGVAPGWFWIGGALGLDETQRGAVAAAGEACGVPGFGIDAPLPKDPAVVRRVLSALATPEAPAGSEPWSRFVAWHLASFGDADGDGRLASRAEVEAVPCEVWQDLDAALRRDRREGLLTWYGLAQGQRWRGTRLGIALDAREQADDVLRVCGLDTSADAYEVPSAGERTWPAQLTSRREVDAVSCSAWRDWIEAAEAGLAGDPRDVAIGPWDASLGARTGIARGQRKAVQRALLRCADAEAADE